MKYAVVTIEWLAQHGLLAIPTMRKSVDGTQVIMKLDHYEKLFPSIMTLPLLDEEETPQEPVYPYPVYEGEELNTLLASSEWSSSDSVL